MKIQPLHDRILVQPILEKEVRKSGIIIPDSAKEKPIEGRVKVRRVFLDCSLEYFGKNFELGGRTYGNLFGSITFIILANKLSNKLGKNLF